MNRDIRTWKDSGLRFLDSLTVNLGRASFLIALAAVSACGSHKPKPTDFHPPSAASASGSVDWAADLARPQAIALTRFETGRVRVKKSDLLDFDDPKAKSLKDEELLVPVYAYLLEHDRLGNYLVDAGLDRSFQKTTSGDMSGLFAYKFYAVQRPGEDLAARLSEKKAKVAGIFFTHLHPDHVSGAASLPRDMAYIVGKGESPKSVGFLFYEDALAGVKDFREIDFSKAPTKAPLGPCVNVFGDGSLWAVATPGHTVGHMSFVVLTKAGPVLLTGDVSHTKWGFEHGVIPGKFNDGEKSDSHRSLDQLMTFAKTFPTVKVLVGHEP